jgi:hypothetical protein
VFRVPCSAFRVNEFILVEPVNGMLLRFVG